MQRAHILEDKLREDRIETYNLILEPFIILLMPNTAWSMDKLNKGKNKDEIAMAKMLSLEYRKYAFKLSLVGSDPVVLAYNELMQFFYKQEAVKDKSKDNLKKMMSLLGTFLLEIRRSMGNETTIISNWQMLEWFMKDARSLKNS